MEAIDNIVKNALDHTESGATISIEWKSLSSGVAVYAPIKRICNMSITETINKL